MPQAILNVPCTRLQLDMRRSRKLDDLLSLLESHCGVTPSSSARFNKDLGPGTLVWLDIFAINQHPYVDKGS